MTSGIAFPPLFFSPLLSGSSCVPVVVSTNRHTVEVREYTGEAPLSFQSLPYFRFSLATHTRTHTTQINLWLSESSHCSAINVSLTGPIPRLQTQCCRACSTQRRNRTRASSGRRRAKTSPSCISTVTSEVRAQPSVSGPFHRSSHGQKRVINKVLAAGVKTKI